MRRDSLSYKTILQGTVIGISTMVVLVVLIGNAMNREDVSVYSPLYKYRYDQQEEGFGIVVKDLMSDSWSGRSIESLFKNSISRIEFHGLRIVAK